MKATIKNILSLGGKVLLFHLFIFSFFTFHFSLISCGSDRKTFLLEGTFKGFNQGELYIYGMNGTHPLDTISVVKGRFHYEVSLESAVTFSLVFPNFSELPVFGEPRSEVEIEGDVSHLKEIRVTGTDMNKQMTDFRLKTSGMTPPELIRAAETFIIENSASPVALYLLNRYFIQVINPDRKKAVALISELEKAQPDEPTLKGLKEKIESLDALKEGAKIPVFTAKDIDGKTVRSTDLNAAANIIFVWAKWNYESVNMQRQLTFLQMQNKDKVKVLGICLDPDAKMCRETAEKDSVKWSTVCDGKMWETPLLRQLGLWYIPDNIILDSQGKIIAHTLNVSELQNKARELLEHK